MAAGFNPFLVVIIKFKMLRQAIKTTPEELRILANKLEDDLSDTTKIGRVMMKDTFCLVTIINKEPRCSDTWEFEK